MENRREHEQLVHDAEQSLRKARLSAEALVADLANAEKALAALAARGSPPAAVRSPSEPVRIAAAEGRRLSEEELQKLNSDDFDVVVDMMDSTVKYREDPEQRSGPKPSDLHGIGPYRINILALMIERPDVVVYSENVDRLLGDPKRIATPQAFTKTVSVLREALGGRGPDNFYI